MRRLALAAVAIAFVALGFVTPAARAATTHPVGVIDYAFKTGTCPSPTGSGSITINAGDSIAWTNCSSTTHTVTADDGSPVVFDHTLAPGETFTRAFPGATASIQYHCNIHPTMHGSILVQPPPTTTVVTKPPTTTTIPPTTTTTLAPTTTSSSTTSTTEDLSGLVNEDTTTSSSDTTTTEKPKSDKSGANALVIGLLVLAIGGVGFGAYNVYRRMQQTT